MLILHQNGCGKSLDVVAYVLKKPMLEQHYVHAEKTESTVWMIAANVAVNYVETPKHDIIVDDLNDSNADDFDFDRNIFDIFDWGVWF